MKPPAKQERVASGSEAAKLPTKVVKPDDDRRAQKKKRRKKLDETAEAGSGAPAERRKKGKVTKDQSSRKRRRVREASPGSPSYELRPPRTAMRKAEVKSEKTTGGRVRSRPADASPAPARGMSAHQVGDKVEFWSTTFRSRAQSTGLGSMARASSLPSLARGYRAASSTSRGPTSLARTMPIWRSPRP